jgi:hypothetical protein
MASLRSPRQMLPCRHGEPLKGARQSSKRKAKPVKTALDGFASLAKTNASMPSWRAPKGGAAIQQEKSQARQTGSGWLRFARQDKCFHAVIASPQGGRGNPAREKPGPSKRLWMASLRSPRQMLPCRHCEPPKGARQSRKREAQPVKAALDGFASLAKTGVNDS